jgi:hypothetical protein
VQLTTEMSPYSSVMVAYVLVNERVLSEGPTKPRHSLRISENKDYGLLDCDAVVFGLPMFCRQRLPPHFLP